MSLDFRLGEIENWKELWPDGSPNPAPKTHAIIFATMAAGMGEITEKNYIEFYLRVSASDAMSPWPKAEPITLEDVRRHIGLRTNVTTETASKWFKRHLENDIREIQYRIRRDKKAKEREEAEAFAAAAPDVEAAKPIDWGADS
jgi:hypothetical protein